MALISNGESGSSVRSKLNTSLTLTQAITVLAAEINELSGVSGNVQTQISARLTISSASSTYLTISNAASTYQPIGSYLTSVDINDINAAGTPSGTTYLRGDGTWSTPSGGGGGSSVFSDLTGATGANSISNSTYTQTWSWTTTTTNSLELANNSLTTGKLLSNTHTTSVISGAGSLHYISSSSADTGTSGTLLSMTSAHTTGTAMQLRLTGITTGIGFEIVGTSTAHTTLPRGMYINLSGTSAGSVANIGLDILNTQSTGGASTAATIGFRSSVSGATTTAVTSALSAVLLGSLGGGFKFGNTSSTEGAVWANSVTPSSSNYCLAANATDTFVNGVTTASMRIGASTRLFVNSSGVCVGNANGVYGKLSVTDTVLASGNYGMLSMGANAFAGASSGSFGRPSSTAGESSNTNGTWLAINAPSGSTADIFNFQTAGNSLLRLSSADSTLTLNVALKASVSASAIFQIDSTTKGVLLPRMTGTQVEAISSPTTGMLVYSTDGSGSTVNAEGYWQKKAAGWVAL